MIKLLIKEIADAYLQENFQRIVNFVEEQKLLKGNWAFHEIRLPAAVANYKYRHNLSFVPKDVLETSVIGASVTWNFALFDREFIDITTAGPTTVRAFIGTYTGGRT